MGCVSSKHSKKQAYVEGDWKTPSTKSKLESNTSFNDLSFEDYHPHLVALTSSSYGLLKVDSPKPPKEAKKTNPACVGLKNEMYDLESVEPAPRLRNEISSMLQTLKPSLQRNRSTPIQGSRTAGVLETIDVADIMQGLDEEMPGSPSPSQGAGLVAASSGQPPPPPRVLRTSQHKELKQAVSFHTIQDLDVHHSNGNTLAIQKLPREDDVSKVFPPLAGGHHEMSTPGKFKTSNAKPLESENGHVSQENVSRRNIALPLPGYQNRQNRHLLTETGMITKENKKTIAENRTMSREIPSKLNTGVPPNMTHSASNGRLKLTLNLEYENTFFSSSPGSSPVGSSAWRSLVTYADVLTEPSSPLFDPALLASYEKALKDMRKEDWNSMHDDDDLLDIEKISKELGMPQLAGQVSECVQSDPSEPLSETMNTRLKLQSHDPLEDFEKRCPPGGDETAVLYTTTLRGIRKTFEDCNNLREMLQSFSVSIDERDVSMHFNFRNELRELMGKAVLVPKMFIKGRYIGGVDEVTKLHEDGKLYDLVQGLPKELNAGTCDGCGGVRFVPCLECSGSRKIVDQDNKVVQCPECNENGLIQCPICS